MTEPLPEHIVSARNKWTHTGAGRPPFAIEPGPDQESVWDYPRPPALVPDDREVIVGDTDAPIARSSSAVRILETAGPPTVYLPPDDVDVTRLMRAEGSSMCEWKGAARYWTVAGTDEPVVAWNYPEPFPEFASIAGWFSFYPGRVRCTLGGELVEAQAGGFYGGWVTSEIVGPTKGDPGTGSW